MATLDDPGQGVQRATAYCKVDGCEWSYEFHRNRGGTISGLVRIIVTSHLMMVHGHEAKAAEASAERMK